MKEKTCVFIGHRDCIGVDKKILRKEIINLIEKGVTEFLIGGMGLFDSICGQTIRRLKRDFNDIKVILVIPYRLRNLKYLQTLYDEIVYPKYDAVHFKSLIIERNQYMVKCSAYAICYVNRNYGGAVKTYNYAKKHNLEIIDIPDAL